MPGIGSQGAKISEPFKAAAGHRVFAIIGSAIYKADAPPKALEQFVAQLPK